MACPVRAPHARVRDRGSVTLETAVCVPLIIVFLGLLGSWGLAMLATSSVDNAAKAAARAASMAGDPATARARGERAARSALDQEGRQCTTLHTSLDTSGLAAPAGQPASVTATVECAVPLRWRVPGMPESVTLTSDFSSPLDPYGARSR